MKRHVKTITQTVVLPAEPAAVFDAFANPRIHSAFTGAAATGSARVGARFTAWGGYISGTNRVVERGRRLVQEWKTTEWPEGAAPSSVEFTFQRVKGGTQVRMVHTNVPADQAASYRQGWIDYYWEPLKVYLVREAGR